MDKIGGRGKCKICDKDFNNIAYHESICGKEQKTELKFVDIEKNKDQRIKELEEENVKLKISLRNLSDRLFSVQQKLNRHNEDSYNDISRYHEER